MPSGQPEATLRKAMLAFDLDTTASDEQRALTQARLQMVGHYLFGITRSAFLDDGASNVDRIFGVDTQNEEFYERAAARFGKLTPAQTGKSLAALTAAAELAAQSDRKAPSERKAEMRELITAVDSVLETIHSLGPASTCPKKTWITRRPAFR